MSTLYTSIAVTNGGIGHQAIGGAFLARRRAAEARKAAAILGVETERAQSIHRRKLSELAAGRVALAEPIGAIGRLNLRFTSF